MIYDKFLAILEKLPAVFRIHLQGVGEPLLNRTLATMVRSARATGARVSTTTNASLLTGKSAAELLDAGINRINVSLDTINPATFAQFRAGLPVESVISNITALSEIRQKAGYPDIQLALALVVSPPILEKLQDIVRLGSNIGLDEVYLQNLNSVFLPSRILDSEQLSGIDNKTYRKSVRAASISAKNMGIRFLAPDLDHPDNSYRCRWPFRGCNITWDGFVSPCCLQPDPDIMHFGNLFETDFATIWNSRSYQKFRDRVEADREQICASCPDRYGRMWHPAANPFANLAS